ncbi:MAG: tetratricopeptide repeat protein, partial [Phycisphaerales bacterium]|nr:tetratricopeptide repeat protein [Phycisphaerales bacterium]
INLAAALNRQDKHAEAEVELRAVLKLLEEVLGAKHPNTLRSRYHLAVSLHGQGKHAEADAAPPLCRAMLTLQEEVLGKEHPHTLQTRELLRRIENEKK